MSTRAAGAGTSTLATVGYEAATVRSFLNALDDAHIQLLVDVRAVAMSRRPGFAKTALAANLESAGIDYLHLRALGTLGDLVRSGRRVAILCFEADPAHCHRAIVAAALAERIPLVVEHLHPSIDD